MTSPKITNIRLYKFIEVVRNNIAIYATKLLIINEYIFYLFYCTNNLHFVKHSLQLGTLCCWIKNAIEPGADTVVL